MSKDEHNPILAELTDFVHGAKNVERDAAKRDEFHKAFAIPNALPTLHQRLIGTIETLLKKHEAYHNSIEHAAARELLRKIRGES